MHSPMRGWWALIEYLYKCLEIVTLYSLLLWNHLVEELDFARKIREIFLKIFESWGYHHPIVISSLKL